MKTVCLIKSSAFVSIGVIGSILTNLFGAFDIGLITLIIFMAVDYITGFTVAAVFKKSTKSQNGALSSNAGFKGLFRKGGILLVVLVSHRLDLFLNSSFIRSAVITAFTANEAISIAENAGLMGIPIPSVITRSIDILGKKAEYLSKENPKSKEKDDTT